MDGWPTPGAVERAGREAYGWDGRDPARVYGDEYPVMEAALVAAGLPELFGVTQASAELGVATSNLGKVAGLPEPLYDLPQGRFWSADAVRRVARSRLADRRARAAAAAE